MEEWSAKFPTRLGFQPKIIFAIALSVKQGRRRLSLKQRTVINKI